MWSKIKDTFLFFTEGEGAWDMFAWGFLGKEKPSDRNRWFSIYRKTFWCCGQISKLQILQGMMVNKHQNKTYRQEVSMSCECVSSLSDRTSAHRSPIVCSRRGSASNTAGNWLIHCLATKQDRKYVYYSQKKSRTTSSVTLIVIIQYAQAPVALTHLTRWQICARLSPLLSEGQSL